MQDMSRTKLLTSASPHSRLLSRRWISSELKQEEAQEEEQERIKCEEEQERSKCDQEEDQEEEPERSKCEGKKRRVVGKGATRERETRRGRESAGCAMRSIDFC